MTSSTTTPPWPPPISAGQTPPSTGRLEDYVATLDDGSQILVTKFPDGRMTVATRADQWGRWGAPVTAEDKTWRQS